MSMKKQKTLKGPTFRDIIMNIKGDLWQILTPLIMIIVLEMAFFLPIVSQQTLNVDIRGIENSAVVNSINIVNIKKPLVDIFSKTNPTNGYTLIVSIVSKDDNKPLLTANIFGMGSGNSVYVINGKSISGNISTSYILLYNNITLSQNTISQDVKR